MTPALRQSAPAEAKGGEAKGGEPKGGGKGKGKGPAARQHSSMAALALFDSGWMKDGSVRTSRLCLLERFMRPDA